MSEVTETGRPRRNTRQSGRLSQLNNGSTPNSGVSTPTSTNPYKKPTYYNSREKGTPPTTPSSMTTPRGRGRGRGRPPGSGSARGGSRGRGYRPECVATRVSDSGGAAARRPSTRGKKKKRGGYSSHTDYHYGSDFESDQVESEPEPQEQSDSDSNQSADDTLELEEAVESDSDDSSVASSRPVRLPSPPVPLWLDEEKNSHVEELEIPESSDDLLLPRDLVVKAVSIYEPLRRFHQLVRLTPFRFEDFCAALSEAEQSSLLAEIHIQLLKSILREEEANGTMFGPPDSKDSVQAILFFMDGMTWADSLRAFMESDPAWSDILNVITSVEYPLCGPNVRIKVLMWLVEMFLATNSVREALLAEGNIRHEDHCRHCNRLGELICCETCPAVYHLGCIDPPIKDDEPPDDWRCTICVKNQVLGVSECVSEMEKAGLLIRHDKLGYDRHGRKYWFLARRILVESDDESEVWYYSTMYQVEELLSQLDSELYESELYDAIETQKDEIFRQMGITEKVTNSVKGHKKSYIDAENAYLKKVHERRLLLLQSEESQKTHQEEEEQKVKRLEEEEKQKEEEEVRRKDEDEKRKIREERLNRRNKVKLGGFDPDDFDTSPNFDTSYSFDERDGNKMDDLSGSPPPPSLTKEVEDEDDKEVQPTDDDHKEIKPADEGDKEVKPIDEDDKQIKPTDGNATVKEETPDFDGTQVTPMEVDTEEKKNEDSPDQKSTENDTTKTNTGIATESTTGDKDQNTSVADTVEPKESSTTPAGKLKSKSLILDMDGEERMTRNKSSGLFKLGQEHAYRTYVNLYSANSLALSRAQHNEERDKKRHMSHKFSLTTASECKWVGNVYGSRTTVLQVIRQTILNLEHAVPHALMHVNWAQLKKSWTSSVNLAVSATELSAAMMMLSNCLRSAVYNTIWVEGSGHIKLMRVTSLEREERKKIEKRDKKDRDEEEDRLRMMPQFVKYPIHPKHQVWKQKGEEYRIHGSRGWLWLATSRPAKPQDCRKMGLLAGPHKHVIQVKSDTGKIKTMLIDPNVFDKLMAKRSATAKKTEASTSSSNGSSDITSDASSPKSVGENSDLKEENIRVSTDGLDTRNESASDDSSEAEPPQIQELESQKETSASTEGAKSESDTTQSCKNVEDPTPKSDDTVGEETMEINDEIETEAHGMEKVEDEVAATDKKESGVLLKDGTDEEAGPSSDKVEDEVEPSQTNVGKEESKSVKPTNILDHHAIDTSKGIGEKHEEVKEDSKKVRTELVNVSLGIQSTNRIQYPKIAHRRPKLDTLLARRLRLQAQEEEMLREKFGEPTLEKLKTVMQPDVWKEKAETEFKKLEASFPLAASYALQCYAYECRSEQNQSTENRKCRCYSPMCRLKFVIQEAQRRRVEANVLAEKEKFDNLIEQVDSLRNYTKSSSAKKVSLKQPLDVSKNQKAPIKYPISSSFITKVTKKPSIFAIPPHELRKLARTGGRTCSPTPFSSVVKTGANSWAWPYPCGRPYFKTCWQYRTVHSNSLAAVALQLRILYAAIRWDDIVMKPPNFDGKNQITTDTEIVTTEILQHRYLGRFQERVQYLRRKHLVPLDAPKTIREVTPSRSGLRKRKKVDAPDQTDPLITEEWVEEDHVELWEIKLYHDKQDRKFEKKPETPVTGMTSTRIVRRPDKYDPSNIPSSSPRVSGDVKEIQETAEKMQRAVHQSKRDNHAKANSLQNGKAPMPTASQQLQQQNALASSLRSYPVSGGAGTKKYIISKPGQPGVASAIISTTDSSAPGILNRKIPLARTPGSPATKTTEILAKIYPTPNGQRLVFQTQPHELTATVLAQIQEQLQGLTGLTAGATISFHIQQPVTTVSTPQRVISTISSASSMLHAGPTRVPSSTPIVQTFKTVEGPNLPSTTAVTTITTLSTSTPASVTNQVIGTRLAGPITFKKVVRNAAGVEEVIQVVSASGTPQPNTTVGPATVTSAGGFANVQRPNETIARIITGGQTHRIVVQSSTQELTPQVIAQIQNQIQGLPGLPVGTPIPIQIQTTHVPNSAGVGGRPLLQTQTLIAQKPAGKLQLSVLPPSGSRPGAPAVSASGLSKDVKIATSPGLIRALHPLSSVSATPTTTIVHNRQSLSASSLTPNILKLTPGTTVVTSQQLIKTPDGKLQAVQLVQPAAGISQIVGTNSRVVGNTLVTPGVAVATSLPLTSAVSTPSALKVQTLNVSADALKNVIPGSPVQIRPAPQVPSTLITSIQGNSPAAVGSNATIIKRSNSNIRNATPTGGAPSVSVSSAAVPMKTQEIFAKAVQTTEGLKFVLQTNGHEMPQALLAQIQAQLQGMNVVPGTTVCFHIKTPDTSQAVVPSPLSALRPSLPVSTLPGSPLKIHPATITTTAATTAPSDPKLTTSSLHSQSEIKQNVMPISPAVTPRLASPIVLKKVVQQQIPEASPAPVSEVIPISGSDAALKVTNQKPADAVTRMFSEGNTPKIVVQSNNPEISAQLIMQIQNQLQGMQVPPGATIPLEIQSSTGAIINSATISVTGPGTPSTNTALPSQEQKQVADSKLAVGADAVAKVNEQSKSVADNSGLQSSAPKVIASSTLKSVTPVKITPSPSKLGQQFLNISDGRIEATKKVPETTSPAAKPVSQSSISSPLKSTVATPPPKTPLKSATGLPCNIMQEQVKFTPVRDIAAAPILANEPDILKDFMPTFNALEDSMPAPDKSNVAQSIVFNDQQFLKALDDKMEVPTPVPEKELPPAFLAHVDAHDIPPMHAVEEVITTVPTPTPTVAQRTTTRNRRGRKPSVVTPATKKIVTPPAKAKSKDLSTKVQALHQRTSALSKQKDLLKKEMLKKRGLLEQQLQEDIQKKITPVVPAATSSGGSARGRKSSLIEPSTAPPPAKKQKLYCVCQKPYDETKFYVGCENCSNWFHGDCVGITEKMAKKVSEYICASCQVDEETNKLYCLCRQPYDESQFYICCDKCQDWFHGRCVGVLQAESKQIDEYVCPNCDSRTSLNHANLKTLSFDDYALVTKLLKQIQAHKSAWPFLEPVDPAEARNYYRVIKNPMDLKTIEMKMESKKYSKLRDFIGDVTKIFENCRYYNPPESAFYKAADALEAFFAQKITLLRQKLV